MFSEVLFSQTSYQKLKSEDNLSEFIYVQLDEFAKNPQALKLDMFSETEELIWRLPNSPEEQLALLYLRINKAFYFKEYGYLNQAASFYEEAYQHYIKQNFNNYDIIEYCLKPLLNTYTRIGAYERAETIGIQIIEIANTQKNYSKHIASGYLNLAAIKRANGAYEEAINYLNEALQFSTTQNQKAKIYSDLAINYLFLEVFDSVLKMVELSDDFNNNNDPTIKFRNLKTLGLVNVKTTNYKKSISLFKEALNTARISFGDYNREISKLMNLIGQSYVEIGNNEMALQFYQESLKSIIPNYRPKSIHDNPSEKKLYAENTLIEAFEGKARAINNHNLALENYDLAFAVEKLLRNSFLTQESKLIIQQDSRERSELCIEICYSEFQNTQDKKWLEKAFHYAEKSKSIVLAETKKLYERSSKFEGDSLFQKRKNILLKTAQINSVVLNEQLKRDKANVGLLAKVNSEKDSLYNELTLLNKQIGLRYPELVEEPKLVSVEEITKSIKNNQLIIEYFVGVNNIYVFKISVDKGLLLLKLDKESVVNEIESFISFFSSDRGSKLQNDAQTYAKTAHNLFKLLINDDTYERLIIIPDGVLNLLSFDALMTENSTITNFAKMPYLVKSSEVNYAFSINLLFDENEQLNLKNVLGFFPVFKNNYRNLAELEYTKEEANSIKKHFKGNFNLGEDALKGNFENNTSNYDIIHLSTHAFAGDFNSPPYIEFYDEKMQLTQIYGYNFDASLLVLSACETGIGVLRKGEGAMSLARGFSYAGIDNLLISLWQVNDKSTQQLMTSFYKNLNRSEHISSSIRKSKLEYLEDESISSIKKSPYYWASFVFIGEYQNVKNQSGYLFYFLMTLLLAFILFLVIKKR